MARKKKPSTKKIKKKMRSYQRVIGKHLRKIGENRKTGQRLESISHMEKEVKAAKESLEKQLKLLGKRKKRGRKKKGV